MKLEDTSTPVLIANCKLGGLAIFRSLGMQGVEVWGLDENPRCPGFLSRYSEGRRLLGGYDQRRPEQYLELLLAASRRIGRRAVLIPTSDELVLFTARHADALEERFLFVRQDERLIGQLISKVGMNHLAAAHGLAVPRTVLPRDEGELLEAVREFRFPVMLKPCYGSGQNVDARQTMVRCDDLRTLLAEYRRRESPESPNMMIQEYLPGGDDDIWIFDGYFDARSRCRAAFTGRKLRQFPVHRGCASYGEQRPRDEVAESMSRFLQAVGYRGPVDAGLRYDRRDGQHKLLDVNPRIGQAFRLFLATDGTDLAQCLYRDLTGQPLPDRLPQRAQRRWMIEDYDLISALHYRAEGSLSLGAWLASLRDVDEAALWSRRDPLPFLVALSRLGRKALRRLVRGGLADAVPPRRESVSGRFGATA
jgi:D-aspartate ligase